MVRFAQELTNHLRNPVAHLTVRLAVRDQAFRFFFEWLRGHLESAEPEQLEQLMAPVNVASASASAESNDFDDDDESTGSGASSLSVAVLAMIESGLTDVWSAIRKMCAKKLASMVTLLGLPNVRCGSLLPLCLFSLGRLIFFTLDRFGRWSSRFCWCVSRAPTPSNGVRAGRQKKEHCVVSIRFCRRLSTVSMCPC